MLEHFYFGSATRVDHRQLTSKLIADIIKNRLRENFEMTVKEARGLVKQKFLIVQPSYNKLWRRRELAIAYLFTTIQSSTYGTKYIIETSPSIKFGIEIFDRIA
jgi:hypothetical protein